MTAKRAKHTPGPWAVGSLDRNEQRHVMSEGGSLVAVVAHECVRTPVEMDADAHLIAAAPDLLAACEALLLAFAPPSKLSDSLIREEADAIRAAIAKARSA